MHSCWLLLSKGQYKKYSLSFFYIRINIKTPTLCITLRTLSSSEQCDCIIFSWTRAIPANYFQNIILNKPPEMRPCDWLTQPLPLDAAANQLLSHCYFRQVLNFIVLMGKDEKKSSPFKLQRCTCGWDLEPEWNLTPATISNRAQDSLGWRREHLAPIISELVHCNLFHL